MMRMMTVLLATLVAIPCAGVPLPKAKNDINGWGTFVDPDSDCKFTTEGNTVTVTIPAGDHDLGVERDKMNSPRVLQPVEGDFTIEVMIEKTFKPGEATTIERAGYNGAGLLVMNDEKNYVRIEKGVYTRDGETQVYGNFEIRLDGKMARFGSPSDATLDNEKPVYLRLQRKGDTFTGYVSQDGKEWKEVEPAKKADWPKKLTVGVGAVNTTHTAFTVRFAELKLKPTKRGGEPGGAGQPDSP